MNRHELIKNFEKKVYATKDLAKLPSFRSGDTVRVHYKIQESSEEGKFRIQHYEGVVTRVSRGTADGSFTVRKIGAGGVGVERIFPTHSPYLAKVEVRAIGVVRRARLYYLRDLRGKAARIKSRFGFGAEMGGAVETPAVTSEAPTKP